MYADENTLYFDEDFGNVVFNCNEMGFIDLNNFDKDDPGTIIQPDFWLGILNLKNVKLFKKS